MFASRHAAKLDAINALSKKELLQLTPQEIERMGGVELFIQAGKRIRYKTFREVCTEYLSRWGKKGLSRPDTARRLLVSYIRRSNHDRH